MKNLICSYKEAQLYQIPLPSGVDEDDSYCIYSIKAKKSELYPDGVNDGLGSQPISEAKAIEKFKAKIDKHLHAARTGENLHDLLEMDDFQKEHTGLLQWESDKAFDGGDYDYEIDKSDRI